MGETVTLDNAPGRSEYGYEGSQYWWDKRVGLWRNEAVAPEAHTPVPDAEVAQYPDVQSGIPLVVWGQTAAGLATSFHISQPRWVKVVAFLDQNEPTWDIPLVDPDGIPYLGPETIPTMVVRRSGSGSPPAAPTDVVGASRSGTWADRSTGWRLNQDYSPAGQPMTRAWLTRAPGPYPHWVLHIDVKNNDVSSATFSNIMVDMIGNGSVPHDATSITAGSVDTHGHYKVESKWDQFDFLGSISSAAAFNDRRMVRGAIDVAKFTTGTYYLATPNALVGDTNPFEVGADDAPFVRVLGSQTNGSYVTNSPESNWNPTTLGLGGEFQVPALQNAEWLYSSSLTYDAPNTRWKVSIFNFVTASAKDRTFFVFAAGKGA